MKKTLTLAIAFATMITACTKKDMQITTTPTSVLLASLKKDTSYPDVTIMPMPAKKNQLLCASIFSTGSLNGLSITAAKFWLVKNGDAAMPADYVSNMYFVVEAPVIFSTTPKVTILNSENTFNNFLKNLPQYGSYGVKVYGDIAPIATNSTGLVDDVTGKLQLTYTGYKGNNDPLSYFETEIIVGQKITFATNASSTIETAVGSTSSVSQDVIGGQEISSLDITFTSVTGVSTITEQTYKLADLSVASVVGSIKIYDGTTLLGTGTFSNGSVTIVGNVVVTSSRVLSAKLMIGTITSSISRLPVRLILDKVKYIDAGNIVKVNDIDRSGNDLFLFKSALTVEQVVLPSTAIVDSAWMNAYKWTEAASSFGPMGTKQHCFGITFVDNGPSDTLQVVPEIYDGSNNITNSVYFTNQNGDTVRYLSKTDTKLFIVSKTGGNGGEMVIPAGTVKTYTLRLLPRGFKHPGGILHDGFSVVPIFAQSRMSPDNKYLNSGTSGFQIKLAPTRASSATAQVQPWIVTDFSAIGSAHSASTLCSNDWFELVRDSLDEQIYSQQ